jgi:hypothetical protein
MTKQHTYKGQPLTDELEEQIAAQTIAEVDAMSDEELAAHTRPPGTLAKRLGRPRLGNGESVLLRARLAPELARRVGEASADTGKDRSEIVREALELWLARKR